MLIFLFVLGNTPVISASSQPEETISSLISSLASRKIPFTKRVAIIAEKSIGTPYRGDPLGEGPAGKYDTDPVINLSAVDCVTFVEQTIALAASNSLGEASWLLQQIRYQNGNIAFVHRNHFMIADWVPHNSSFCHNITGCLHTNTVSLTRTIDHKHFYRLKNIPSMAETVSNPVITIQYIPRFRATQAEQYLPDTALIFFIGEKPEWLFVLHCGFYVRNNGQGLLIHASSASGQVTQTNFATYLSRNTHFIGFTAYALTEPAFPRKKTLATGRTSSTQQEKPYAEIGK